MILFKKTKLNAFSWNPNYFIKKKTQIRNDYQVNQHHKRR